MRIGLVTGEYPPMQGGVGDFTRELAHALIDLGHFVAVITSTATPAHPADSPIHLEPIIPAWGRSCWQPLADAAHRLELDVLNLQYEPAAYRMQVGINLFPWWYRRQPAAAPIVATFHDLLVPYLFPKAGRLRWKIVEFLARRSDAVIVTNEEDRRKLFAAINPTGHPLNRPAIHAIPIGSNISPRLPPGFDRAHERARWGAGPNDWLIGYFGFLNMSKGGLTLLRAIGLLLNDGLPARLLLIGGQTGSSDPENARYAAEVERALGSIGLHTRTARTGYVEPVQVSMALAASDAIALPYADGASFRRGSLMAALAHAKAVVTTQPRLPLPELIDGDNCLLVQAEDPSALAEAIRRAVLDSGLRARLEAGARDLSAQFAWDKIAARTARIYTGVTQ